MLNIFSSFLTYNYIRLDNMILNNLFLINKKCKKLEKLEKKNVKKKFETPSELLKKELQKNDPPPNCSFFVLARKKGFFLYIKKLNAFY